MRNKTLQFVIKLAVAGLVIVLGTQCARIRPTLAGLIAVMPLTGLIVMLWFYSDCQGNPVRMSQYTLGAVWGILPTMVFFGSAYMCFRKGMSLGWVLGGSSMMWILAALVHQYFLRPR